MILVFIRQLFLFGGSCLDWTHQRFGTPREKRMTLVTVPDLWLEEHLSPTGLESSVMVNHMHQLQWAQGALTLAQT